MNSRKPLSIASSQIAATAEAGRQTIADMKKKFLTWYRAQKKAVGMLPPKPKAKKKAAGAKRSPRRTSKR